MDQGNAFRVVLLGADTTTSPFVPTFFPAVVPDADPSSTVPPRRKRRGWKCNPEWLMSNMTTEERQKLSKKGINVPKVWTATTKMTRAKERQIRAALRKVRNVASAQRHRETQRSRVATLETQLCQRDATIRDLVARIRQLESVIMAPP
tara:strand:- start:501 stop:947 length:447 start_codon:yes stop_codon:yes gene_type:complete